MIMNSTFRTLAEPNRLRVVELLREGPLTVGEIANRLGLSQPQASKHLRALSAAGFVEVQAIANRRICKLRLQPLLELEAWLESFRHSWDEKLDRLGNYMQEL
ncbi:metalloregulator ArsR/SmtB family transcription factor [Paenibacillus elgii]|nr:metalloregulator ArsR/SmtB family transcription factor [Paenibacillus elgii]MCM3270151.1 metalloregulator ArsR/SmtB family transcription factor [Paenibacillus elgii]